MKGTELKYISHYTVKWHDTDDKREARPGAILVYMQETANAQLRDTGLSLDDLRDKRGLAFLLSRISVRFHKPLYAYEKIDVETWVTDSRGLSCNRCFRVLRGGEVVAEAYSTWALMDLRDGKLLRAEEFPYDIEGDAPLDVDAPKRVHLGKNADVETAGVREIRYSDIDYNGHMNNTRYPDMLCDFLPDVRKKRVVGMALSYLREATFGHALTVFRAPADGGWFFRTVDGGGEVCLEAHVLTEDL